MSRAPLACASLIASLAVAVAAAEELPVRDPMRPFGHDSGGAVGAAAAPGSRFALTGVVISPLRRVAIVNGKPYREGERVDGAEIVAIEPRAVRLDDGGTELVIPLGTSGKARQPIKQGETVP